MKPVLDQLFDPVLHQLMWAERWDEATERMRTEEGKAELSRMNRTGDWPLHLACFRGAPIHLVEAMLGEFPGAVTEIGVHNCLPLHEACHRGDASPRVVKLLLDAYPEGVEATNEYGGLPLHDAAMFRAPLEVLRMLIAAHPAGATTSNGYCQLPIHCLADAEEASPENEEDVEKVKVLFEPLLGNEDALLSVSLFHETPLHVAARFNVPILHTCVTMESCPAEVVMTVALRHPDQLRKRDGDGNYPLHLAASNPNLNGARVSCPARAESQDDGDEGGVEAGDSDGAKVERDLIGELVKLYPGAASARNADGRFPLCLAIESGKRWDEGVEAIADAAGHVVVPRDKATCLCPFMLAASTDDPCLDTVFGLLVRYPVLQRYQHVGKISSEGGEGAGAQAAEVEVEVEDEDDETTQLPSPSGMRVREILSELRSRGVSYSDCFNRDSIAARLVEEREGGAKRAM